MITMGNLHVRIDDRLIHGQIVTSWANTLNIKRIIAIDDEIAENEMVKGIMLMGIPREYNPEIVTLKKAIEILSSELDTKNILLITRFAKNLKTLKDFVKEAKEINIGNCSKQSDSVYISKGIGVGQVLSFSQEDVDVLDELHDEGLKVVFQQMPSDKVVTWPKLKESLKETNR